MPTKGSYGTRDLSIAEKLGGLQAGINELLSKVDQVLRTQEAHGGRLNALERKDGEIMADVNTAHDRLRAHHLRIESLEQRPPDWKPRVEKLEELQPIVRAIKWVGGIVIPILIGLAVTAWWKVATLPPVIQTIVVTATPPFGR